MVVLAGRRPDLTGNQPDAYGTNGIRYCVRNGICYLDICGGSAWNGGGISTNQKTIATLPEGVRPSYPFDAPARVPGSIDTAASIGVFPDGRIVGVSSKKTLYFRARAVFPVA